jgi:hypothetical protein
MRANTDQMLAAARAGRLRGGRAVKVTLPVAEQFAAALAEEFPDGQAQLARALAKSAGMLTDLMNRLLDGGATPISTAVTLVNTLSLTAESLHRKAGDPT